MIDKCKTIYKKYEEIINYLIFGVLTTAVNLVVKWVLLFTVLDATQPFQLQLAVVLSWICAVAFAYATNRIYVFKSKSKKIIKEICSFFGGRIFTLVLEMFIMYFFVTFLKLSSDMWVVVWTIFTQVLVVILNYFFSKWFIFKNNKK